MTFGPYLNSLPTLLSLIFIQVHSISKALLLLIERKGRDREERRDRDRKKDMLFIFRAEKTLC